MRTAVVLAALIFTTAAAGAAQPAETTTPATAEISQVKQSQQFGTRREDFRLADGHAGFVVLPPKAAADGAKPWIWYAPTFVGAKDALPDAEHDWLFGRLLARGMAIAGVDVGESFGNPAGRAVFTDFHRAVVKHYGLDRRACLLPQSRGGLMLYNWAAEHTDCVQCIGGIYPVCDQASWPGLDKSCAAYGMSRGELAKHLAEHNPIDRLAPLARAKIPILHLHGDADALVPLDRNSGELARRYRVLGGPVELIVVKGKGHYVCPELFQNQRLLDFFLRQGEVPAAGRGAGGENASAPAATRPASAATPRP